jgi:hypothetical protein
MLLAIMLAVFASRQRAYAACSRKTVPAALPSRSTRTAPSINEVGVQSDANGVRIETGARRNLLGNADYERARRVAEGGGEQFAQTGERRHCERLATRWCPCWWRRNRAPAETRAHPVGCGKLRSHGHAFPRFTARLVSP